MSPGASVSPRPLVRLVAFAALGLYGALRWATLLSPAPAWRLLALLAVAVALAGGGAALGRRSRPAALLCCAAAAVAIFPLAGIPIAWVLHARLAAIAGAVGDGLSALPGVLVPYLGSGGSVRVVIVLGAGVLLLDAALLIAFAPGGGGAPGGGWAPGGGGVPARSARRDLHRAGAALPLVALAVVPSTLVRGQLPYLGGVVLFGLLVAFMWGERIGRAQLPAAIVVAALAAAAAALAAPALDRHRPWVSFETLAGTVSPARVDTFDWSQSYGPLDWPRTGRQVLQVRARRPDYWKAENLDEFDGREWVAGSSPSAPAPTADPGVPARWAQALRVTIGSMRTSDLIAAGLASRPARVPGLLAPGPSAGTWRVAPALRPGDSYLVRTYSPRPTPAELGAEAPGELASALAEHPGALRPYLSIPGVRSPYARAFALARRLARAAPAPYAYVVSVERYLSPSRGFRYDESPPLRKYPLESFLFRDKLGYCQQFSGAMALLLRIGGVPARVAAGFTTGAYDPASHAWRVSDLDAHAWVEAWFAHYGWVRFDPTPASAPARAGQAAAAALGGGEPPVRARVPFVRPRGASAPARESPAARGAATALPASAILALAILALAALIALALRARRRRGAPGAAQLVAELQRALARCGRPIGGEVTLATLERDYSLASSPGAAGYVRAIRIARFGGGGEPPTAAQRRALRHQLRAGLGVLGRPRAWWALPPRGARRARGRGSSGSAG